MLPFAAICVGCNKGCTAAGPWIAFTTRYQSTPFGVYLSAWTSLGGHKWATYPVLGLYFHTAISPTSYIPTTYSLWHNSPSRQHKTLANSGCRHDISTRSTILTN